MTTRLAVRRSHIAFALMVLVLVGCNGPAGTVPPDPDPDAPTVTSTVPGVGATDVARNTMIAIEFSHPMDRAATVAAFGAAPSVDCTHAWNTTSTRLTCHLASLLAADTTHEFTIGVGAQAASGHALAAPYGFAFTTGATVLPACVFGAAAATFSGCVFGP